MLQKARTEQRPSKGRISAEMSRLSPGRTPLTAELLPQMPGPYPTTTGQLLKLSSHTRGKLRRLR